MKVSEKTKKRLVVMAPGGRQSKRVGSIPLAQVVNAGSSRILNRLKTTGAPEQHVSENISPVAANSTSCDSAQAESTPVAKNQDCSYAYDGGLDEDETEGNPIPGQWDAISEGWFLCYQGRRRKEPGELCLTG